MPPASPFCARVSAADWRERGVDIAHWLLVTTNTTGRVQAAGDVDGRVDIALGGRAITEYADGRGVFFAVFERGGDAGCVQRLVADGDADRQVALHGGHGPRLARARCRRNTASRSPISTPRQISAEPSRYDGTSTSVSPHRGGKADGHRFLSESGCIGAGAAGALQADELGIECAGERHEPIYLAQEVAIARDIGQSPKGVSLLIEILPPAHFEARNQAVSLCTRLHLPIPSFNRGVSRLAITARRKRAASPPVTQRWS